MNTNKKRIIAVICLLVFIVGIFVACKKKETDEKLVSVSTDENGSLYYTDPTYEVDGINYGGETHFVKPDETNKSGEYKVGDVTSQSYTTDNSGNLAPVSNEGITTVPNNGNTTTTAPNNSSATPTSSSGGDNGTSTTTSGSGSGSNADTSSDSQTQTDTTEEPSFEGIGDVVSNNNLNNDGVIPAW